jgi:multiple sugar transport system substrate-binding protein
MRRRSLLAAGLGAAATPLLGACGGASTSGGGGSGAVNFASTQFTPIQERQKFEQILKTRARADKVAFNPMDAGVFGTTVKSQLDSGKVQISLIGGLHGDLAPYADKLMDVDDVTGALADRHIPEDLLTLGKLGGGKAKYVPWMQASYVIAVHKTALQWLPSGADVNKLTYDQFLAWMTAGKAGNGGKPIFGFPAGPKGLYHRFFQGFLLPSFTGGQVTTFRSPDAVQAWQYMKELWAVTAPASTNYDFMQEPLARGEVLVGGDHVARLVDAPSAKPDEWTMVPAPSGPKGLGYMLVIAGLAIPQGAPEAAKAKDVIKALSTSDAQLDVLKQNAFFPVVDVGSGWVLPPAVSLEFLAVGAQQKAGNAITALPPVGVGSKDAQVSLAYTNCFREICLNGKPVQGVLDAQASQLNAILDGLKVPCWRPDPVASGTACRVA